MEFDRDLRARQEVRLLAQQAQQAFAMAASSVSPSGLKSFMNEILSCTCSGVLIPESTISMPGKPAAKRMA